MSLLDPILYSTAVRKERLATKVSNFNNIYAACAALLRGITFDTWVKSITLVFNEEDLKRTISIIVSLFHAHGCTL
jgi:hypothetical protein